MPIDEPVALVTGTSRGIGAAIARRLCADGYRVVGVSRSGSEAVDSDRFVDVQIDLAELPSTTELVAGVLASQRRLDVLVNNAATIRYADCWALEPQDLEQLLTLNLTVPFILSQAAVRHWIEVKSSGLIVNICSVESELAWRYPPQAGYTVTKGGLLGLTRTFAHDFADIGIRVNGVAPGIICTDLTSDGDVTVYDRIPMRRLGSPEEVAGVVSFLCGPDASYMTGEVVFVDGGYRLP